MHTEPILAKLTLHDYNEAREKYLISLERKHEDLRKYAARKDASQWVIDKGNAELNDAYEFIQKVEDLMNQMYGLVKDEYLQNRINRLKKLLNL